MRFPRFSPLAGQQGAAHWAVYKPMNEPQPMGEAGEGSEALLHAAGIRSSREGKGRGRGQELGAVFLGSQHSDLNSMVQCPDFIGTTIPHTTYGVTEAYTGS